MESPRTHVVRVKALLDKRSHDLSYLHQGVLPPLLLPQEVHTHQLNGLFVKIFRDSHAHAVRHGGTPYIVRLATSRVFLPQGWSGKHIKRAWGKCWMGL